MGLGGDTRLVVNKRSGAGKRMSAAVAAALLFAVARLAQAHRENGWVCVFNGKDLTGWKINGEERWVAENGTILCESTAGKYGYLTTEKTYRDFDLRLKFEGEAAGNTGVFFHSRIAGMNPQTGPDIVPRKRIWNRSSVSVLFISPAKSTRFVFAGAAFSASLCLPRSASRATGAAPSLRYPLPPKS